MRYFASIVALNSNPKPMTELKWFFVIDEQEHGPVPEDTLISMFQNGVLTEASEVWCDGMAEWQPAGTVFSLMKEAKIIESPPTCPHCGVPLNPDASQPDDPDFQCPVCGKPEVSVDSTESPVLSEDKQKQLAEITAQVPEHAREQVQALLKEMDGKPSLSTAFKLFQTLQGEKQTVCPTCKAPVPDHVDKCTNCNPAMAEHPMPLKDVLFSFKGRLSRSAAWRRAFPFMLLVGIGIAYVFTVAPELTALPCLVMIWLSLVVGVKRLHDRNRTGWFLLAIAVPVFGFLIVLWLYYEVWFLKGTEGRNKYGPQPLD